MSIDYNRKLQFPTNDNYVARLLETEFTESKRTGNPMIHFKLEVVSPDLVEIDGKQVNIAGVTVDQYMVSRNSYDGTVDESKTADSEDKIRTLWERLGLDPASIDFTNIDVKPLNGLLVMCAMGCDVEPQRKSPTPEQRAKRQEGDVMTNPITGKPLVYYKPKIVEIFGLAPDSVSTGSSSKPY